MNREALSQRLSTALVGRRLLDHPFYRRWSMGFVTKDELAAYARQYRHFERLVPALLEGIVEVAPTDAAREQARRNLADETGPTPHLALFERFAAELDARDEAAPSPAMEALLQTFSSAAKLGAAEGFAALWAYEAQAAEVSASKAHGLRQHHRMSGPALAFWDVHAEVDVAHAAWAVDAMSGLVEEADEVHARARAAADAWWAFLDEREGLAAAA